MEKEAFSWVLRSIITNVKVPLDVASKSFYLYIQKTVAQNRSRNSLIIIMRVASKKGRFVL